MIKKEILEVWKWFITHRSSLLASILDGTISQINVNNASSKKKDVSFVMYKKYLKYEWIMVIL